MEHHEDALKSIAAYLRDSTQHSAYDRSSEPMIARPSGNLQGLPYS